MKNDNFHTFFSLPWLQMLNLPALLQNKNTRIGPFPWKRSVLQNPDRERTNQSTGICLGLGLPYNKNVYFIYVDAIEQGAYLEILRLGVFHRHLSNNGGSIRGAIVPRPYGFGINGYITHPPSPEGGNRRYVFLSFLFKSNRALVTGGLLDVLRFTFDFLLC